MPRQPRASMSGSEAVLQPSEDGSSARSGRRPTPGNGLCCSDDEAHVSEAHVNTMRGMHAEDDARLLGAWSQQPRPSGRRSCLSKTTGSASSTQTSEGDSRTLRCHPPLSSESVAGTHPRLRQQSGVLCFRDSTKASRSSGRRGLRVGPLSHAQPLDSPCATLRRNGGIRYEACPSLRSAPPSHPEPGL